MITDKNIDGGKPFDWGLASKEYAQFRDIYPEAFYQNLIDLGLCIEGQSVLDLGTGTGVLPRNLYRFGADFTGMDISENQIVEAKRLSEKAGMDIKYKVSSGENMDFSPNSFDVVTACQCFIYFDTAIVLPKIHEALKPNGHFCVIWVAWLPEESVIAKNSEELILKYNPSWTGAGYTRHQMDVPQWVAPLFAVEDNISYDIAIPFTRESWHGRMIACRGVGASSLPASEIAAFEKDHLQFLDTCPESFDIPHHVTVLNLSKV